MNRRSSYFRSKPNKITIKAMTEIPLRQRHLHPHLLKTRGNTTAKYVPSPLPSIWQHTVVSGHPRRPRRRPRPLSRPWPRC